MPAGSIILDLLMRTGAFETDTDRAAKRLKKFQNQVADVSAAIGTGLVAAAGLAAVAFDQLAKGAADFKDLEEKFGGSAESFAALAVTAGTAGASMAIVGDASAKLTKNLQGVDDESKAAGAALKALGIPIEDFKRLDPAARFEAVAKSLAGFRDGTEKTAAAIALFGKTGAELLPFLKQLEQDGGRQVILTQKQIELADEYADRQARLTAQIKLYAQAAAADALPAFNDLTEAAKELLAEFIGLDSAGKKLNADSPATAFAERLADGLAFVVDAGQGVARTFQAIGTAYGAAAAIVVSAAKGEFGAARRIAAEVGADIDKLLSADLFSQKLERLRAAAKVNDSQRAIEDRGFDPTPRLAFNGPSKPATQARAAIDESTRALAGYVDGLKRQLDTVEELSASQRALNFLTELGTNGQIPQVRQLVLDLAARNDELKDAAKIEKQIAETLREQEAARRSIDTTIDRFSGAEEARRKAELTARLEERLASGEAFTPEQLDRIVKGIGGVNDAMAEGKDIAHDLGLTFSSAFEDALIGGGKLRDVLHGLEQDLVRIITRKLITEPLANAATNFAQNVLPSFFGARADGGDVLAGRSYLVGEAGPERFVPRTAGTILPNADGKPGSSRGRSMVVNNSFTVQGNVDRRTQGQIAAEAARALQAAQRDL